MPLQIRSEHLGKKMPRLHPFELNEKLNLKLKKFSALLNTRKMRKNLMSRENPAKRPRKSSSFLSQGTKSEHLSVLSSSERSTKTPMRKRYKEDKWRIMAPEPSPKKV